MMALRSSSRGALAARTLAVIALVGLAATGCAGSQAPRPLASYGAHFATLFDDGIDGSAVGFASESKSYRPKADPLFRARVEAADGVVRLKVVTISAKADSTGTSYILSCRVEQKLAGAHAPTGDIELRVSSKAPSAGILRSLSESVVGMHFVAFLRDFVRPDGEKETHFHFAPDTPIVVDGATNPTGLVDWATPIKK
ncbi:MAG TPA: hypothetical protein PLR99_22575 [Polyangiaceae bacterium]|nr:hypothetical protein [Polyangiaceae bacterium]